eukprot:1626874-Prymnesium_polylepis.1
MVENAQRVEMMYPDEVAELNDDTVSAWAHGFNSGMLEALRMIPLSTRISNQAQRNFPNLVS